MRHHLSLQAMAALAVLWTAGSFRIRWTHNTFRCVPQPAHTGHVLVCVFRGTGCLYMLPAWCAGQQDSAPIHLQVDISWDFSHLLSGPDSSALLSVAAWNICPVTRSYHGEECFYAEGQTFDSVTGSLSLEIPALPDAEWQLKVDRDYFHKVSGAVRNKEMLKQAGERRKIAVAWLAATRGHEYELEVIQVVYSSPLMKASVAAASVMDPLFIQKPGPACRMPRQLPLPH